LVNWREFFPFPEWRPAQAEALDFIVERFAGADDILIEAPTGIGKSAMAITLARWRASLGRSSYISTTTLPLEDQYMGDFARLGLRQLHSKSHYQCPEFQTCDIGSRTVNSRSRRKKCLTDPCFYQSAKVRFMASSLSISNANFLLTCARHVKGWNPRETAIFDEGHMLHETVANGYEIQIMGRDVRHFPTEGDELEWLKNCYAGWVADQIAELEVQFQDASHNPADPHLAWISKRLDAAERKAQNLSRLLADDPNEWVFDLQYDRLNILPVWGARFAKNLLPRVGSKRIYLSATLHGFEQQCRLLGVDPAKAAYLSLASPFPVENRLVHVCPLVKWDYKDTRPAITQLCKTLDRILNLHPGDRGIVHVSSYTQARAIIDGCQNTRLVAHDNAREKESLMVKMFAEPGTVIVSPSSHEGLDLYDDRSRFQVIAKLPFANLGDKRVKRRKETDANWYTLHTAQKLIQACGRSIRSETDHAVTYLVDAAFERFYGRAYDFFPAYFRESLRTQEVDL
jgi:ATP-dependent DNA helicase DinG